MDDLKTDEKAKCFAIVRGSNPNLLNTALHDLCNHAHLRFLQIPKRCDPNFADNVLVRVLNKPLKSGCKVAAIVPVFNEAGAAIHRLIRIHPPAHVIILSPRHEMFEEVGRIINILPDLDFTMPKYEDAGNKNERECS